MESAMLTMHVTGQHATALLILDKNRTKAITGSSQLTTRQYSPDHPWVN
jgi:hypothetical protein